MRFCLRKPLFDHFRASSQVQSSHARLVGSRRRSPTRTSIASARPGPVGASGRSGAICRCSSVDTSMLGVSTGARPGGQGDEPYRGDVRGRGQHRGSWTCCAPAERTGCSAGSTRPATLGSFLRSFTHGHVRQLQAAARRFTANLIGHAGLIPPGEPIVFLDIDSKVKQVYGPGKQGASFGYTKVRGLHFQIVATSTPPPRPVIGDPAAQGLGRLRQGRRTRWWPRRSGRCARPGSPR